MRLAIGNWLGGNSDFRRDSHTTEWWCPIVFADENIQFAVYTKVIT